MRAATSVMFLLALAPALAGSGANTFDFGRVGPLRIGMTQAQAEQALGSRIKLTGLKKTRGPMDCGMGDVRIGSATVSVLFDGNRLQQIGFSDPGIRMSNGLGIGSRARDIERVYGKSAPYQDPGRPSRVWSDSNLYDENDHRIHVDPPLPARNGKGFRGAKPPGIQFDFGPLSPESKVKEISVGQDYAEGCA